MKFILCCLLTLFPLINSTFSESKASADVSTEYFKTCVAAIRASLQRHTDSVGTDQITEFQDGAYAVMRIWIGEDGRILGLEGRTKNEPAQKALPDFLAKILNETTFENLPNELVELPNKGIVINVRFTVAQTTRATFIQIEPG